MLMFLLVNVWGAYLLIESLRDLSFGTVVGRNVLLVVGEPGIMRTE